MTRSPEISLPEKLRENGRLRGNEWAWPVCDIPAVIEAARLAGLVSIGGQLQFRFPEATCELYWIGVDTFPFISSDLAWRERVEKTAVVALSQFRALQKDCDFLAEGQSSFGQHLDSYRAGGGDPRDAMCFVWYLEATGDLEQV
ncbi:hypothetical protein [Neorhizobium sp. S3-V5DH]|uniref:hypothetical protein n=1 Tax=Neorhizobium sp. S3-V5DH TaxID=2485166 RepID=UPI001043C9FF|nr:hypothetical protein [Neorhizobium sp. S3-V5DH]TCV68627.1 hypothetical protein EDE09_11160 [Neorhizobium sp. S3-V5DH]